MAPSPRARTLLGVSIAVGILSIILLCVVSDGGAWEGASGDITQNGVTYSVDIDFGLANAKFSAGPFSQSVSYDDLASFLGGSNMPDNIKSDFDKLKTGGKIVSAMIGLAVTCGVLNLAFLILILMDKLPSLHKLAPVFGSLFAFFSALPFIIWIAMPHEALRDFFSMDPSSPALKLHWCFVLSIIAFVFCLATMFVTLRARDAALQTADATPYAMPVGGQYVPPAGVAYQPLQDPAQGQPYNPYAPTANPFANQYSNTSQPN